MSKNEVYIYIYIYRLRVRSSSSVYQLLLFKGRPHQNKTRRKKKINFKHQMSLLLCCLYGEIPSKMDENRYLIINVVFAFILEVFIIILKVSIGL